jgi:hypothetical protein
MTDEQRQELTAPADQCRTCADYYQDRPGHFGPSAAVDLYFTIARVVETMLRPEQKP